MLDFVRAFPLGDMVGVGSALERMGFTKELSEAQSAAFAADLQEVFASIDTMAADAAAGGGLAAGQVDETQLNRAVAAVAKVAEGCARHPRSPPSSNAHGPNTRQRATRTRRHTRARHTKRVLTGRRSPDVHADGIRFPREFALLVKQVLYFDRYTRLLAPGLDVLNDERLSMNRSPSAAGGVADASALPPQTAATEEESVVVTAEVLPPE